MKRYIAYFLSAWLIIGFTFLAPEKALSQAGNKTVTGITPGRARALVGVAAGLISLIIGWRAKARSAEGTGNGRTGAIVALVLGLIGLVLSIVHLITSAGAVIGSGGGKAGAILGLLLGFIGMTLGGLALRQKKI